MLTSKQRAQLRGLAAAEDTIVIVGKGGITENVVKQTEDALKARELVKGKVLETALLSAREASDAVCAATGAEGVSTVGYTFVIWRKSKKLEAARQAKAAAPAKKKVNPVKVGRQKRRAAAKAEKERRRQFFHDEAVKAAIERRKQFYQE